MKNGKRKSPMKTIGNVLLTASIILLVFAIAFSLFVRTSSAENDTTFFGYKPLHIVSGSMEPTIRTGSIILSKRADFDTLQVGDVISYDNGSELITHRVIAINADGSLTAQGDANLQPDAHKIVRGDVKFVLVRTMNWTAPVIETLSSPVGIVILVLLLADIVQFSVIMLFVRRKKQKTSKAPQGENTPWWLEDEQERIAEIDPAKEDGARGLSDWEIGAGPKKVRRTERG